MTDIEAEILLRFLSPEAIETLRRPPKPEPPSDVIALAERPGERWDLLYSGPYHDRILTAQTLSDASRLLWENTVWGAAEFTFYLCAITNSALGKQALMFHGPREQRIAGLITLLGATDVLLARKSNDSHQCVHAKTGAGIY